MNKGVVMHTHVIALVDCDCFFVSCERKDNPSLCGKPVCVMTGGNGKGIIVSRSKEAKALGIKMGAPYFQIKNEYSEAIFIPSRMHRYAEISRSVMDVLRTFTPDTEVSSVDEAYLDLTGLDKVLKINFADIIRSIRRTVLDKTGIPVSIGLGSSKLLAKLASDDAKTKGGIFVIPPDKILETIGNAPIEDVCGIGRKNAAKMSFYGVFTVRDFMQKDNAWIKKVLGSGGIVLKTELSGIAVSPVESSRATPQSIQDTASFDDFTSSLDFLRSALGKHVHTAGRKLRKYNGFCKSVEVMLKTKDFHCSALHAVLDPPTNSDFEIRAAALKLLEELYRPGVLYRADGVTLRDLDYGAEAQKSLFESSRRKDDKLSRTIDELESIFGSGIVKTMK